MPDGNKLPVTTGTIRGECCVILVSSGLERSLSRSNLVDGALSPGRWLSHSRLNSAPRVPGLTDKQ